MAGTCWSCVASEYHDYAEDPKGVLRCPRCGELEKDDPNKVRATRGPGKKFATQPVAKDK